MTFEDRQREAMMDFNRSSFRDLLASAVKRAQAEADIRRYELEEYERANGFRSNVQKAQIPERNRCLQASRLDASREVTGRDAFAGAESAQPTHAFNGQWWEPIKGPAHAETYTRRNAEDISTTDGRCPLKY